MHFMVGRRISLFHLLLAIPLVLASLFLNHSLLAARPAAAQSRDSRAPSAAIPGHTTSIFQAKGFSSTAHLFSAMGDSSNDGTGPDGAIPNRYVLDVAIHGNGQIFAAGHFNDAAGIAAADKIAGFNPATSRWFALEANGGGSPNCCTETFFVSIDAQGDVLVGAYQNLGGVAQADVIGRYDLDHSLWSGLGDSNNDGSGANGALAAGGFPIGISAAAFPDNDVVAGGLFSNALGIAQLDNIGLFNAQTGKWSAMGDSNNNGAGTNAALDSSPQALTVSGNDLVYAGGGFTDAAGIPQADYIAVYNRSSRRWAALGDNNNDGSGLNGALNGIVRVIKIDANGSLVVGGEFTNAGGVPQADYIARYTPATGKWSALGDSNNNGSGANGALTNKVFGIAINGDGLVIAGGSFANLFGIPQADYIAKYDPQTGKWAPIGDSNNDGTGSDGALNAVAYALALDTKGNLIVGGGFTNAAGIPQADRIVKVSGFGPKEESIVTEEVTTGEPPGNPSINIDPSGWFHSGAVWVYVPKNAIPQGFSNCQMTISENSANNATFGFTSGEKVYDISVVCGPGGDLTTFDTALTICIQPSDGVTKNKQLFHRHRGESSFSISPAVIALPDHVCGTSAQLSLFTLTDLALPDTGFALGVATKVPGQPAEQAYTNTDIILSIPQLNVETVIVGVPLSPDGWDVSWLGQQAGYLEGSAFPTRAGNTVLTGHVWDSNNQPGPFVNLHTLQHGDQVTIQAFGGRYIYEVHKNFLVSADDLNALTHSDYDILTLLTCEGWGEADAAYRYRRVVQAVLVVVEPAGKPGK